MLCSSRVYTVSIREQHEQEASGSGRITYAINGFLCTGLLEMIVGVLTTCHTQYN